MQKNWRLGLLGVALLALVGCGGSDLAPVSGVVTLDGKPLAGAEVSFQPIGSNGQIQPGIGSFGKTDAEGRYSLRQVESSGNGAVLGKHKVRISRWEPKGPPESDLGGRELLPLRYNQNTTLESDVAAGGSDKADFALQSAVKPVAGR